MDLPEWLQSSTSQPTPCEIADMISLLFRNLEITGVVPSEQRQMIHGLHRKHLVKILEHNFPNHYLEILTKILNLCSCNMMDPDVLYDLLNSVTKPAKQITADTDSFEVQQHLLKFAETGTYDMLTVVTILSKVSMHFEKDRLNFGLYGLYPKYRCYIKPLSYIFLLLGNQLVCKQLAEEQGALSADGMTYLWKHLKTLFNPWICPINPGKDIFNFKIQDVSSKL